MKIVVADCSVKYDGRGHSFLPKGKRAILIKNDGSISVHNETGNKPVNYMKCASHSEEEIDGVLNWKFSTKNELIEIEIFEIFNVFEDELIRDETERVSRGSEKDLQKYLSENPKLLVTYSKIVKREFATGQGAVDLMIIDRKMIPHAIEVKRTATMNAVGQLRRYVESMKELGIVQIDKFKVDFGKTTGIIAAYEFKSTTESLALKHGIKTVVLEKIFDKEPGKKES